MHARIKHLSSYFKSTWALRMHTCTNMHRPYVFHHQGSEQDVEKAHLQRVLTGSLNTGLIPSSSLYAKEGGGTTNFAADFYRIMGGGGKVAQDPYTITRKRVPDQTPAATCIAIPSSLTSAHACRAHRLPACVTCQRLRLSAATCCSKGHHASGYVGRRLPSKVC